MKLIPNQNIPSALRRIFSVTAVAAAAALFVGCQSDKCCAPKTEAVVAPAAPTASAVPAVPASAVAAIRINAGSDRPVTDAAGHVWLADRGFVDGETIDRGEVAIANTTTPAPYRTERYSMSAFSQPVPNGKYTVKLHFAETFEGITAAGARVFSFNVEGKEYKDFDVFAKAGGANKAYVETVNVAVTDGKLDITFQSQVENPEINAVEIIPAS